MKYTAVSFTSPDIEDWQKDLLIAELGEIGYDTFEDKEDGFVAYVPTSNLDIPALDHLLVYQTDGYHIDYTVEDIDEQNWNVLWESNFNPIVVDNKCYVRATFHDPKPQFEYEIVIDPKMSFGTGHHQTTSMMLSYILENDFQGKSVLDMGCGTGILAILAAKRGASDITAIDYDEICVESVGENKVLNNIQNIQAYQGSKELIEGKVFDIILANINRNILMDHLSQYSLSLSADGSLYISGFYDGEDLDILKQKAEELGLLFEDKKVLDNWCAAKFLKR